MSYDLDIWTTHADLDASAFPKADGWEAAGNGWTYQVKPGWLINIEGPQDIEPEDAPAGLPAALPGLKHLFQLTIEPIGAPKAAYDLAIKTACHIAHTCAGVVFDSQLGDAIFPTHLKLESPGAAQLAPYRQYELELSWAFESDVLTTPEGVERFLALTSSTLPEALPRRYDITEPHQFSLQKNGADHFASFLSENRGEMVFWSTKAPVDWAYVIPHEQNRHAPGLTSGFLRVMFDAQVLRQPAVQARVRRFWKEMSLFLKPFYGEARIIGGWLVVDGVRRGDGDVTTAPLTGTWMGMPPTLGHAVVVGPPYVDLWPELKTLAQGEEGVRFASVENWQDQKGLAIEVPSALTQVKTKPNEWADAPLFPTVWPFGDVYRPIVHVVPDGLDIDGHRDSWERHPYFKTKRETLTRDLSEFLTAFNEGAAHPLDVYEFCRCNSLSPRQLMLIEDWLPRVSPTSVELLLEVLLRSRPTSMQAAPITALYDLHCGVDSKDSRWISNLIGNLFSKTKFKGIEPWLTARMRNAEPDSRELYDLNYIPKQLPRATGDALLKEVFPKDPAEVTKLLARRTSPDNLAFLRARRAETSDVAPESAALDQAIARMAKRLDNPAGSNS